jgi:hypothetical protein
MPGSVIEIIRTATASAAFPRESAPGGPWGKLADALRSLVEDEEAEPVAAIELTTDDKAHALTIEAVGRQPVDIDLESATVDLTLFGEDESWLESHHVDIAGDEAAQVAPGWKLDVAVDHTLDVTPERTLQVVVELALADEDGFVRTARLTKVLGRGWGT